MINDTYKQTFDLPPSFGDSDTINMISYRLYKFHGQSLELARQKAIVWLNPDDYRKAEYAYAHNPLSFSYLPPIGDFKYFPIRGDKVISCAEIKQGVMEIETIPESFGEAADEQSSIIKKIWLIKKDGNK